MTVGALFRALVRRLDRDPSLNAGLTPASRAIAVENKWRAQRYGIHGTFVDEAKRCAVSVGDALDEVIRLIGDDAADLGCLPQVEAAREILTRGTSADRQLSIYRYARCEGGARPQALGKVVDWLISATEHGAEPPPARLN